MRRFFAGPRDAVDAFHSLHRADELRSKEVLVVLLVTCDFYQTDGCVLEDEVLVVDLRVEHFKVGIPGEKNSRYVPLNPKAQRLRRVLLKNILCMCAGT